MMKNPAFVFALFVFALITVISLEVNRMYRLKDTIDIEMQRAVNTSEMLAVDDDYRIDKIAYIDTDKAKQEFQNYLINNMGLNGSNEKVIDGKVQYTLVISSITAVATPPAMEVKGELQTSSLFLKKLTSQKIKIPFHAKAKTVRID